MADASSHSWSEIRRTLPLNERRMAYYAQLTQAEQRLEAERVQRGVPATAYEAAQVLDPATGEEETDDLARLARSVAALGGRLRVEAVFPEGTLRLLDDAEI